MERMERDGIASDIIKEGLGRDISQYVDDQGFRVQFEKLLPSPPSYLERIRQSVDSHPVKYVRYSAMDKEVLEGSTHVDLALMNSKLLVLVEAKFTSDIQCDTTYDPVRNQLARLIDTGIHASHDRKLVVLLLSPEWAYKSKNRLYYYKLNDYRSSVENIQADVPHRSPEEIANTLLGVGWVSLEYAASTVHKKAAELALLTWEDIQRFYEERRITLTV